MLDRLGAGAIWTLAGSDYVLVETDHARLLGNRADLAISYWPYDKYRPYRALSDVFHKHPERVREMKNKPKHIR